MESDLVPEFLLLFTFLRHLNYFSQSQFVFFPPSAITTSCLLRKPGAWRESMGKRAVPGASAKREDLLGGEWSESKLFLGPIRKEKIYWEESEVKVAPSCLTLCDPMDCSPPGFSVREILQARMLDWVAIPSTRGSSQPGDWTQVSTSQADSLPSEPPGKPIRRKR